MKKKEPLTKLSIIIPARDEEACIRNTVEHLHLELSLRQVPHEIIVVDDGSTDNTFSLLESIRNKINVLKPIKNEGPHGFGRALCKGFEVMSGDAVVIMMAD